MDTHFIFEKVQKMRPSSFSEEERHRYQAEKMMLRQFLLMKQQEQVSDYLTVRHMKTWLLTRRSFLEEFQEIIERTGIDHLFMAELAWTTARHFCLSQMEQELLEELDREKRLSQLLSRKVTLEGLQMFVSVVHPAAEEDVKTLLPFLHRKLLQIFGGVQLTGGSLSAGDVQPAKLLELEQSAASLVPEVGDTALKFLLEEPEQKNQSEAASAEIGKLLRNSAAPCLSKFGGHSETLLLGVCTTAARLIFKAVHKRFDKSSMSFKLMDYDDSHYIATEGVISAIQDMEHKVQTDTSSQAHLQLEEGPLEERGASLVVTSSEELEEGVVEEREASPRVSLDEDIDSLPNDVRGFCHEAFVSLLQHTMLPPSPCTSLPNDVTSYKEEETLEDSAVHNMDQEVQTVASSQHTMLPPSPCTSLPNDVTSYKEEETLEDSAVHNMDQEVQTVASSQAHPQLEEGLVKERGASPGVSLDEMAIDMISRADGTEDTPSVTLDTSDQNDDLKELQQDTKGVRAFFRGVSKTLTCCLCSSTED